MNRANSSHYYCDMCRRFVRSSGALVEYEHVTLCQHCHEHNEHIKKLGLKAYKKTMRTYDEGKCECGADKCNTTHSTWCPKYRRNK